jgi:hypothetical protein
MVPWKNPDTNPAFSKLNELIIYWLRWLASAERCLPGIVAFIDAIGPSLFYHHYQQFEILYNYYEEAQSLYAPTHQPYSYYKTLQP